MNQMKTVMLIAVMGLTASLVSAKTLYQAQVVTYPAGTSARAFVAFGVNDNLVMVGDGYLYDPQFIRGWAHRLDVQQNLHKLDFDCVGKTAFTRGIYINNSGTYIASTSAIPTSDETHHIIVSPENNRCEIVGVGKLAGLRWATSINDHGIIAGGYDGGFYLYDGEQSIERFELGSMAYSVKVNNNGYIAFYHEGEVFILPPNTDVSDRTLLPALAGLYDINDNNLIVGIDHNNDCIAHDVSSGLSKFIRQGYCGYVAFNNAGTVIYNSGYFGAKLWDYHSERTYDLDELHDGLSINRINDINNNGQIVYEANSYDTVILHPYSADLSIDNDTSHTIAGAAWGFVGGKIPLFFQVTLGNWQQQSQGIGYVGEDYHVTQASTGSAKFTWTLDIIYTGEYEVLVNVPDVADNTTQATYQINAGAMSTQVVIDQNANAGREVSLGRFTFQKDGTNSVALADSGNGRIVADNLRVVLQ